VRPGFFLSLLGRVLPQVRAEHHETPPLSPEKVQRLKQRCFVALCERAPHAVFSSDASLAHFNVQPGSSAGIPHKDLPDATQTPLGRDSKEPCRVGVFQPEGFQ